ncbi:MAG TPA: ChbG/HpnK family deacetylase, partial [Acidobacteriota bacterium]|nr:ChbG/HpnK family deacetylase [Acidobacteriota bacterium]
MLNRLTPLFAILPCLLVNLSGQTSDSIPPGPPLTLSERLGYTPEDKLLIVHADDVGLAHSVNLATFDALATGQVTSGSIMVPCAWLEEVTDFTRTHPQADLGLHLTLTSGSEPYQRGPVSLPSDVPSLITSTGYLYESPREAAAKMDPREVEIELKSQIRKARALGIEP